MKKLLLLTLATCATLALAPTASAGCWATVKLSSMPDGRVWDVKVTPLQHGFRPLPNAKPRIEIRSGTAPWKVFAARKTAQRGVFRARVVFPTAGTWQLRIWDGFEPHCARYHTYAPVVFE
jgi:hypothetical protein